MNKLKFLYDVVKTMRAKDSVKGALVIEASRNRNKVLEVQTEFEKNTVTGTKRSKIKAEYDCDGRTLRHESSTEVAGGDCHGWHGRMHQGLRNHIHQHFGTAHCDGPCGGIKNVLGRIGFMLQLLQIMKLEETADKSVVLSINFNDLPDETKREISEKIKQHHASIPHHPKPEWLKSNCWMVDWDRMEDLQLELSAIIKPNFELEKGILVVDGVKKDEDQNPSAVALKVELDLFAEA